MKKKKLRGIKMNRSDLIRESIRDRLDSTKDYEVTMEEKKSISTILSNMDHDIEQYINSIDYYSFMAIAEELPANQVPGVLSEFLQVLFKHRVYHKECYYGALEFVPSIIGIIFNMGVTHKFEYPLYTNEVEAFITNILFATSKDLMYSSEIRQSAKKVLGCIRGMHREAKENVDMNVNSI